MRNPRSSLKKLRFLSEESSLFSITPDLGRAIGTSYERATCAIIRSVGMEKAKICLRNRR